MKNETDLIMMEWRFDGVINLGFDSEAVIVLDEGRYSCAWSACCKLHEGKL